MIKGYKSAHNEVVKISLEYAVEHQIDLEHIDRLLAELRNDAFRRLDPDPRELRRQKARQTHARRRHDRLARFDAQLNPILRLHPRPPDAHLLVDLERRQRPDHGEIHAPARHRIHDSKRVLGIHKTNPRDACRRLDGFAYFFYKGR